MKIRDRIESLRRTLPLISTAYGRYMHAKPADMNKRGRKIVLWVVIWSDDGRVSLHRTEFSKMRAMSAAEWGGWLQVNLPEIMINSVLAYVNRSFGSTWNIDRVFGWHFASAKRTRR